jgi:eukaryotic-like serine/threonine-protein kinase
MGAVYEARHRGTGRRVAVKVIAGTSLAKNPEIVARFQREAMASGAIESQYIAQVLDTGVDPATGSPYTVMELLSGEDLQQAIARHGALAPDAALRIAAQACLGLRKAHESQVVHRDIKPANLYLARREDGDIVVKLLDFGIAKVIAADQLPVSENAGLTRTGAMIGSPLYMSPEQMRGKKDVDHRTDIWSMGIVLYEALSGVTPYGHVETMGELVLQICSAPPRHLQDLAPWVPAEAAGVVHRALAMNPAQRFDSAAQMFDALKACLPQGYGLTEAMLAGVPQSIRSRVAPKLELSSGLRALPPSSGALAPTVLAEGPVGGATMNGVANARTSPSARRSPLVVLVPVALGMAAIGALAVSRFVAPHRDSQAPPAAAAPSAVASAPAPVESATLAPLPVQPVERTVRVVVLPAEARARVDGADAPVQSGLLSITGSLGSTHRVHLSVGRREASFDVTIAEEGPVPPKVELEAPASKSAIAAPATPPPRPVAAPVAPPPATTSGMHMEMK